MVIDSKWSPINNSTPLPSKHTQTNTPYPPPKATLSTTKLKIHRYSDNYYKGGTWITFVHERACPLT